MAIAHSEPGSVVDFEGRGVTDRKGRRVGRRFLAAGAVVVAVALASAFVGSRVGSSDSSEGSSDPSGVDIPQAPNIRPSEGIEIRGDTVGVTTAAQVVDAEERAIVMSTVHRFMDEERPGSSSELTELPVVVESLDGTFSVVRTTDTDRIFVITDDQVIGSGTFSTTESVLEIPLSTVGDQTLAISGFLLDPPADAQ